MHGLQVVGGLNFVKEVEMKFKKFLIAGFFIVFSVSSHAQLGDLFKSLDQLGKTLSGSQAAESSQTSEPNYVQIKSVLNKYNLVGKWSPQCFDKDSVGATNNYGVIFETGEIEIYQNGNYVARPRIIEIKELPDNKYLYVMENYSKPNWDGRDNPVSITEVIGKKLGINQSTLISSKITDLSNKKVTERIRDGKYVDNNADVPISSNCDSDEMKAQFRGRQEKEVAASNAIFTKKINQFLSSPQGKSFTNACASKIGSEFGFDKKKSDLVCGCLATDHEQRYISSLQNAFKSANRFNDLKKYLGEVDRLTLAFSMGCVNAGN